MLSLLTNKVSFKIKNKKAWKSCWQYWYKKEYVHQGIREYLLGQITQIKNEKQQLKILDLGCGSAWGAKYYEVIYDQYIGVDFNEVLIEQLRRDFGQKEKCSFWNYDIESNDELPFPDKEFDLILGNFILLELSDLAIFFEKAASLQNAGQYLVLTGLDPLNEILRVSISLREINKNLFTYRHATSPVVLSKKMSFNGDDTSFLYYRVLYSINDIITIALNSGYEICEINDKLNKNADSSKSPIYYTIKLKRKC